MPTVEAGLEVLDATPLPDSDGGAQDYDAFDIALNAAMAAVGWVTEDFWKAFYASDLWFTRSTAEWIDQHCTTEMAVSADRLEILKPLLNAQNLLLASHGARWMAQHCDTCVGHTDGTRPIHLSIEQYHWAPYDADRSFDVPA